MSLFGNKKNGQGRGDIAPGVPGELFVDPDEIDQYEVVEHLKEMIRNAIRMSIYVMAADIRAMPRLLNSDPRVHINRADMIAGHPRFEDEDFATDKALMFLNGVEVGQTLRYQELQRITVEMLSKELMGIRGMLAHLLDDYEQEEWCEHLSHWIIREAQKVELPPEMIDAMRAQFAR